MNTLDALIALLTLLASLSLIVGALAEYNSGLNESENIISVKLDGLVCASIVDGMYASSADYFENEINCFVKDGKIASENEGIEKLISVIPKVKKEYFLEVEISEHYK